MPRPVKRNSPRDRLRSRCRRALEWLLWTRRRALTTVAAASTALLVLTVWQVGTGVHALAKLRPPAAVGSAHTPGAAPSLPASWPSALPSAVPSATPGGALDGATSTATRFMQAWLATRGKTHAEWETGLAPYAAAALRAELAVTDLANVPGTTILRTTPAAGGPAAATSRVELANGELVDVHLDYDGRAWHVEAFEPVQ